MKTVLTILIFAVTSTHAQYYSGWQKVDTVTTGNFNDYDPQLDHGGLGQEPHWVPFEWFIFDRQIDTASEICAMKVKPAMNDNVPTLQWDSSATITLATDRITQRKKPDICTIFSNDTVSVAAWMENDPWLGVSANIWDIYYSHTSGSETQWSTPAKLTTVGIFGDKVKVRTLSDSSFILIWNYENVLMFSTFSDGKTTTPDTLVVANYDSTEFDWEQTAYSQPTVAWTGKDSSGKVVCFVAQVASLNPVVLSQIDTVNSPDGDVSNPKFMNFPQTMTLNVKWEGRFIAVLASSYPDGPWQLQDLAASSFSDNLDAVAVVPELFTVNESDKYPKKVQNTYGYGFYAWEHRSNSDTSLVFLPFYNEPADTVKSTGYNRNPAITTYTLSGYSYEIFPFVWESNRTGSSHLYGRTATSQLGAVNEQPHHDAGFVLNQNFPNPFNPTTVISYQLSSAIGGHVTLKVYDVLGRLVTTLVDDRQNPGEHTVTLDAKRLASGIYFYQLRVNGFVETKKMLVEK